MSEKSDNESSSSLLSALKDVVPVLSVVVIGIAGLSNGLLAHLFGFSYFRYASIADHIEGVIGVSVALIVSVLLVTAWKWACLLRKLSGQKKLKKDLDRRIQQAEDLIESENEQIPRLEAAIKSAITAKSLRAKPEPLATQEVEAAEEEFKAAEEKIRNRKISLKNLQDEVAKTEEKITKNSVMLKRHAYVDFMGLLSRERPALLLFVLTFVFTFLIAGVRYAMISVESYAYLSAENIERGCYKPALRLERVTFLLRADEAPYVEGVRCPKSADIISEKFGEFINNPVRATVDVLKNHLGAGESLRYVVPTDAIRIFQSATYINTPPARNLVAEATAEIAAAIKGLTLPVPEPPIIERFEEGLIGRRLTPSQMKSGEVYWRGFEAGAYGLPPLLARETDPPTDVEILEAAPTSLLLDAGQWHADSLGNLSQQFSTDKEKWNDEILLDLILKNRSRDTPPGAKAGVIDVQILGFADGRGSYALNAALSHYRAVVVESALRRAAKELGYEKKFRFFHCYVGSDWEGAVRDTQEGYQNPWLRRVELRVDDAIFDDERACTLSSIAEDVKPR